MTSLETAAHPQGLRRVAIDPVSRVEGHGKVTILLDAQNKVQQVRLHIVEFRGFEKFIEGRPYWEVPVMVQRLCGICPVSHHLAASKALDHVVGAVPVTPSADKIRRLMHYGQVMQSNALHFFHLSSPDLLFGFDSEVNRRNIVGVAAAHPDIAKKGVLLRKYGQEVIRATAGKRVHGTGSVPGGMNKHVSTADRELLLRDVQQMIQWSQDAVDIAKTLHAQNPALYDHFGAFRSNMLSLVRADGALDLYDGVIRARDAGGAILFDGASDQGYLDLIEEEVKPWTYMKFPFLKSLGRERGWLPRRATGPAAELRLHPQPAGGSAAPRVSRLGQGPADPRPAGLPLGAHDRGAALHGGHRRTARRPGHPDRRADGLGSAPAQRRGRDRGTARHADPPLRGRRRRPGDDVQPDRLDHPQQPGDERVGARGGARVPRRQGS